MGVAVVLGLTLAIFALGSKVASTRSENSSTNLAAESDARIEVRVCVQINGVIDSVGY